jgi:nucleoside-diphosphate-sugar epimerase
MRRTRPRILIVGCGDVALRVAGILKDRYQLLGAVRHPARLPVLRTAGIRPISADLDQRRRLKRFAGLGGTVLHFAPPPEQGDTDARTRHLLATLSQGTLPVRLIYISTSGVYGDCRGDRVSETRPLRPATARARRRADAERLIRRWAGRNGVRASILRVPGIYGANRLPLERLRAGTPAIIAQEDSHTNHIHADDLARIVVAAWRRGRPNRVYHACDDGRLLRRGRGRLRPAPSPAPAARPGTGRGVARAVELHERVAAAQQHPHEARAGRESDLSDRGRWPEGWRTPVRVGVKPL